MAESVNHPDHYGGANNPYEVIKVLEQWLPREEFIGGLKFNIQKYYARAHFKGGDEDCRKGAWYAAYLADFLVRSPSDAQNRIARVDAAFARQLRESIERRSRLIDRLRKLVKTGIRFDTMADQTAFDAILNDEEPVWPAA